MYYWSFVSEVVDSKDKAFSTDLEVAMDEGLHVFTFKQLHSATGGFSKSNVVGHGGFGSVYRGVLSNGRKVAVKLMDQAGKQGEEEFKMEVCYEYCSKFTFLVFWYLYFKCGMLTSRQYTFCLPHSLYFFWKKWIKGVNKVMYHLC